jgi:hypothetical protein
MAVLTADEAPIMAATEPIETWGRGRLAFSACAECCLGLFAKNSSPNQSMRRLARIGTRFFLIANWRVWSIKLKYRRKAIINPVGPVSAIQKNASTLLKMDKTPPMVASTTVDT